MKLFFFCSKKSEMKETLCRKAKEGEKTLHVALHALSHFQLASSYPWCNDCRKSLMSRRTYVSLSLPLSRSAL